MFEEIQKECDLVLFNNLVYLAETNGHANPSLWVVEKLDSMGVETTATRHDDNSLTLVRSKGYTMEIHNLILNELDPQMTPEAMAEAFHILVANAAGSGRSKQWVIDSLTEVGATIVSDDEIDLTPDHIAAVENLIDPPAEVSDEELQILYKALEARAELVGLDADALSQNHGAINPDYELTPFVLAELTRQVDQWEKVFGPGANETIPTIDPEHSTHFSKPDITIKEFPSDELIDKCLYDVVKDDAYSELIPLSDFDLDGLKQKLLEKLCIESSFFWKLYDHCVELWDQQIEAGLHLKVGDLPLQAKRVAIWQLQREAEKRGPKSSASATEETAGNATEAPTSTSTPEPVKKKGRKSKASVVARLTKIVVDVTKLIQDIENAEDDDVQG